MGKKRGRSMTAPRQITSFGCGRVHWVQTRQINNQVNRHFYCYQIVTDSLDNSLIDKTKYLQTLSHTSLKLLSFVWTCHPTTNILSQKSRPRKILFCKLRYQIFLLSQITLLRQCLHNLKFSKGTFGVSNISVNPDLRLETCSVQTIFS